MGWVSGHRPPSEPGAFFVWQVAIAGEARGQGLASRMVSALLSRPAQQGVITLIATVTEDNQASLALFSGLARDWNAPFTRSALFERDTHFAGAHATEYQVRIGPLDLTKLHRNLG